MLTWLFERKIFSPTISDRSTFIKKKYSRRKISDAKFYIRLHRITFVYVHYISDRERQTRLTQFYQYSFVQYN